MTDEGAEAIQALARSLATARRSGTLVRDATLRRIGTEGEADVLQALAVLSYDRAPRGYTMAATSPLAARLLRCERPVLAPLFEDDMLPSGSTFRLPHGVLGVGAGFTFVVGRSFPVGDDLGADRGVEDVIVSACPSLQLLGRRVPGDEPLNDWTATADFGLSVAHVNGPVIEDWRDVDLAEAAVMLRLDGNAIGSGQGRDTLGHPLAALAWLARTLAARGSCLEAGDMVATGSCTGLAQVTPGQTVEGDFASLGNVTLVLR